MQGRTEAVSALITANADLDAVNNLAATCYS